LILHDGQNLFDAERAHRPGHTWQVAETAAKLIEQGRMPPIVIAGIDHAAEDRIVEMTPTGGNHPGAGQVARYGRFVVEELVPFIEAEYEVDTRGGRLGMGGSSLGGLATLAIAQQYPSRFGRLLVMSPSLWWDDAVILKRLRRQPLAPDTRVWLDVGLKEGRQTATLVRRLRWMLTDQLDAGNVNGVDDPAGDHTEDRWASRLPEALAWLFGDALT
jgi:predicted alpha/beta superfamily hydrolase